MINKIKQMKAKVKLLLEEMPHLRDSDERLVCNIWFNQIGKEKLYAMTAMDLLATIAEGKLESTESILRARRKVQEENETLRGKSYNPRKKKQIEITQNINKL